MVRFRSAAPAPPQPQASQAQAPCGYTQKPSSASHLGHGPHLQSPNGSMTVNRCATSSVLAVLLRYSSRWGVRILAFLHFMAAKPRGELGSVSLSVAIDDEAKDVIQSIQLCLEAGLVTGDVTDA